MLISERRAVALLGVATALFLVLALHQAWTDGPTYDEGPEVATGLAALTRHDLRGAPQHPPLGKVLAAAPLLFRQPYIPSGAAWQRASGHAMGEAFVRHDAASGRLQADLFTARIVPILEAAAVGWLIALLAGRLFGTAAGVFAALLWLLNPFVIGLGHLDGIDIPATFTTLLTALAVLHARRKPSARGAVLVGICAGLAILARVTGLLVVVMAAAALLECDWRVDRRRACARAVTVAGVAWATVIAAYAVLSPVDIIAGGHGVARVLATFGHVGVPPAWLRGTGHLLRVGSKPGPSFVLGQPADGRSLLFWPASLLVKLPPLTLLALVVGPFTWIRLSSAVRREAAWCVGLPALAHAGFTALQQRPIGLRYLLPVLALWCVAAGPIVTVLRGVGRRAVVAVVVAGGLVAALATPALSWTDPLLGPGYQVATDSNLDWGQSYPALQKWSEGRRPWVAFFGSAGLGVDTLPGARDLAGAPEHVTGWVAVSASDLTAYQRDELSWLRAYCPVDVLGASILVYHFTTPADRSLHGPDRPAGRCGSTTSVVARSATGRSPDP